MSKLIPENAINTTRGRYELQRLYPESDRFDDWLGVRRDYVEHKKWKAVHSDESDRDRFDQHPDTIQIVSLDKEGDIIVGMRLTPVDRVEDSLSWSMLSEPMRAKALLADTLPDTSNHSLWDLTRLVRSSKRLGSDVLPRFITRPYSQLIRLREIAKLYGEGYEASRESSFNPPLWVFTTERSFADKMNQFGIPISEIVSGYVNPNDSSETVFGYVDPGQLKEVARDTFIGKFALKRIADTE